MKCKICNSKLRSQIIGKSPVTGYHCVTASESLDQPSFPLDFKICDRCYFGQYEMYEGADKVLDRLYSQHLSTYYLTNELDTYLKQFCEYIYSLSHNTSRSGKVLEIGCNNGRVLHQLRKQYNIEVTGVEPSKSFTNEWRDFELEVVNDYFNENVINRLTKYKFDVIFFRHVFEHIPDPVKFFGDITKICDDITTIVIEVPYIDAVFREKRLENVSYSHLNYFSLTSMIEIASKFNFSVVKFTEVSTDGGSMVVEFKKGEYKLKLERDKFNEIIYDSFFNEFKLLPNRIKKLTEKYEPQSIIAYGAGAKGQHLLHISGLSEHISVILDDTSELLGKYVPGTSIIIENPETYFRNYDVSCVLNLVPTHSETIRRKVPQNIILYDLIQNCNL